jgi:hypothetical protein
MSISTIRRTRLRNRFKTSASAARRRVINLVGFLQALQRIRYNGRLRVEVFGRTKDMTPELPQKPVWRAHAPSFAKPEYRKARPPTSHFQSLPFRSNLPRIISG